MAGIIATLAFVAVLAVEIIRLALASEYSDADPVRASRFAPLHPDVLASTVMAEVGEAAAIGASPSQETLSRLRLLASREPLRAEPFLVAGALASRKGDYASAKTLLEEARRRAPRSAAARYLLADMAFQTGEVLEGLRQLTILSRLLPGASVELVPALAQYARTPGAKATLSSLIAENPQLKVPLLTALATDRRNTDLVLDLAAAGPVGTATENRGWQSRLLLELVNGGEVDRAYRHWREFAGLAEGPRPLIFNGQFAPVNAPPPFNWTLATGSAGLAESENGRLRVIYYGREEAVLASQLLILPPGTYRFSAPTSGDVAPQSLEWAINCTANGEKLLSMDLGRRGAVTPTFTVPVDCRAQTIQLVGLVQEMPRDTDARTGPVSLARAPE